VDPAPDAPARSLVGVPTRESLLTDAAVQEPHVLLPPGTGRRVHVLTEVEIGIGRPDIVVVAYSPRALDALLRRSLRISNLTEARLLAALLSNGPQDPWRAAGITRSHGRRKERQLADRGWLSRDVVGATPKVVGDSLLVEAKVSSWRAGLLQLVRTRGLAHRAALLVSAESAPRVDRRALRKYGVGLLTYAPGHGVHWVRRSTFRGVRLASELWLGELVARSVTTR